MPADITGVEGYVESAASGLMAGINAARHWLEKTADIPRNTAMTMAYLTSPDLHISNHERDFGLFPAG